MRNAGLPIEMRIRITCVVRNAEFKRKNHSILAVAPCALVQMRRFLWNT